LAQKKDKQQSEETPIRDAVFNREFREDLVYWIETDRKTALRAFKLIEAIVRDPFTGIGKPERLKHLGSNTWYGRAQSMCGTCMVRATHPGTPYYLLS